MILLQGFLNAITVNSFFGLVSYFPIDIIISMSSGQGIAGILMNFIQYIVLFLLVILIQKINLKLKMIILVKKVE